MSESGHSTLKHALDTVRQELKSSAASRFALASEMRTELEHKVATLLVTQATIRKPVRLFDPESLKRKVAGVGRQVVSCKVSPATTASTCKGRLGFLHDKLGQSSKSRPTTSLASDRI